MAQVRQFNPPLVPLEDGGLKRPTVAVFVGDGRAKGLRVALVVRIRATAKGIRGFDRVCQQRGIHVVPLNVSENVVIPFKQETPTEFECIGSEEALEYLSGHPSVVEWHFLQKTANPTDCRSAGSTKK